MRIHWGKLILARILTGVAFASASVATLAFAVVGGQVINPVLTPEDQAFFLEKTVQIQIRDRYGSRTCSGTLLDDGEVLSAGHCIGGKGIYSFDASDYETRIKVYDPKSPTKYRELQGYEGKVVYSGLSDLSLIRYVGESPSKSSTPIAFAKCDDDVRVIVGFGMNGENTGPIANRINYSDKDKPVYASQVRMSPAKALSTQESSELMSLQGQGYSVGHYMVFRQTTEARTCFGDSGGPIYCKSHGKWAVAAVTGSLSGSSAPGALDISPATCRRSPYVTATNLSETLHILERLRDRSAEMFVFSDRASPSPAAGAR